MSILGSREVSIGALTSDGRAIEMIAAEGRSLDRSRRLERTALDASSPMADAVGRGGAVLLGSPEELDRRYPELAARYTEAGDRAWVWLPLEASGGSVGTLFVSYEEPQVFDERERAELQVVADQVALALERSLLQQAREEAVRLSARVERVKAVSGAMTPTSVSRRSRPRSSWRRRRHSAPWPAGSLWRSTTRPRSTSSPGSGAG